MEMASGSGNARSSPFNAQPPFLTLDHAREGMVYFYPYLPIFVVQSPHEMVDFLDGKIRDYAPTATLYRLRKPVSRDLLDLDPSLLEISYRVWAIPITDIAPLQTWIMRQRWTVPSKFIRLKAFPWPPLCNFDLDIGKVTMMVDDETILPGNSIELWGTFGVRICFEDDLSGTKVAVRKEMRNAIRP